MAKPPDSLWDNLVNGATSVLNGSMFSPQPQHPAHPQAHLPAHTPRMSPSAFLDPENPHAFNVPTWLLLVKTEGQRFGLQRYTNSINLTADGTGHLTAHVEDPAMLREIMALRSPHLSRQLYDGYVQSHHNAFPLVGYAGVNAQPDGQVRQDQQALQTLGFDIGVAHPDGIKNALTDASMKEFMAQTHPPVTAANVHQRLHQAAQEAQADAAKYAQHNINMTPAVAGAMRNAAGSTGMHYSYLMQTAQRESSFDPRNSPDPSDPDSVVGLFQMKPMTWIGVIKQHGAKYGLGNLASQITGANGYYHLRDPQTYQYAMSLRTDPRLNAALGAELQNDDRMMLPASLRNDDGALYAYQLLGATHGRTYENGLAHTPNAPAAHALPSDVTTGTNRPVFFNGETPKTFAQVNEGFNASFTQNRIFDPPAQHSTMVAGTHHPKKPGGSTPA